MESRKKPKTNLIRSFKFAFEGIYSGIKTETNWKIGLIESIFVLFAGFYFNITKLEWIIVLILIGIVLYAELCNSAIEAIVDSFTQEEHPGAKLAKDFSAGSVVIMIIASGIVGVIIFAPYVLNILGLTF